MDQVIDGRGASIGCEITVTTTIDHGVGNVSKCIKAGFDRVAVVSGSAVKLAQLEAAMRNGLGADGRRPAWGISARTSSSPI
ncbi:MAG: hypothetical protein WC661_21880 [Opitutaceae bacterium]|jgi:hypothetical protein